MTRRIRDMKANDEIAQEHIDLLESQLLASDLENQELRDELTTLRVEYNLMIADREHTP